MKLHTLWYSLLMPIRYGLVEWERVPDEVYTHSGEQLQMGIDDGPLSDFLRRAGDDGWELCAAIPVANVGMKRSSSAHLGGTVEIRDGNEAFRLVFKKHDLTASS